ncbi:MAG: DUF177 domain-containing protein [Chitinophagaceae bacterium]|nr:DUF177 domain-containing protein [Chitinophagaceae bacterium]
MELHFLNTFDIDIRKLHRGDNTFSYTIQNSFFEHFENGILHKADASVEVVLHKTNDYIKSSFFIRGNLPFTCDRSLESFLYPIDINEYMFIYFGEEEKELEDDSITILHSTYKINIAQYIYYYMVLAVPLKKIHPRYKLEEDSSAEEVTLVYTTNTFKEKIKFPMGNT